LILLLGNTKATRARHTCGKFMAVQPNRNLTKLLDSIRLLSSHWERRKLFCIWAQGHRQSDRCVILMSICGIDVVRWSRDRLAANVQCRVMSGRYGRLAEKLEAKRSLSLLVEWSECRRVRRDEGVRRVPPLMNFVVCPSISPRGRGTAACESIVIVNFVALLLVTTKSCSISACFPS